VKDIGFGGVVYVGRLAREIRVVAAVPEAPKEVRCVARRPKRQRRVRIAVPPTYDVNDLPLPTFDVRELPEAEVLAVRPTATR
jgi:hypothetical protein